MTNFLKEKKTYKFFYSLRELQTADKRVLKKNPSKSDCIHYLCH